MLASKVMTLRPEERRQKYANEAQIRERSQVMWLMFVQGIHCAARYGVSITVHILNLAFPLYTVAGFQMMPIFEEALAPSSNQRVSQ